MELKIDVEVKKTESGKFAIVGVGTNINVYHDIEFSDEDGAYDIVKCNVFSDKIWSCSKLKGKSFLNCEVSK